MNQYLLLFLLTFSVGIVTITFLISIALSNAQYKLRRLDDPDCNGHGKVVNENCVCDAGFACTCLIILRFHGTNCSIQCPGYKSDSPDGLECNGNGNCEEDQDGWYCECNEGYFGDACDESCPGLLTIDNVIMECSGHGVCSNDELGLTCKCNHGYYGDDCTKFCPGLLEIDDDVLECYGHGTCDEETLKCSCSSDHYTGEECACDENTCGEHGKCNDQMKCECDSE